MKKTFEAVRKIQFTDKSVPWVLLAACLLAFGPLITKLGIFQDDWDFVFNYYAFGDKGLFDFLQHDGRPYAIWIFWLGFRALGFKPLYWHVAELLLRWMTGVSIWFVFKSLWPKQKWQNLTAALLFVLYPFFTLQPLATTYTIHWTGYLFYSLSILFMLQSVQKHSWIFACLAIFTQLTHLLTLEYYAGIEFLRPIFLWVMFSSAEPSTRRKIIRTLKAWLPYLIAFTAYFVWRGFIYQAATEGRNTPAGLIALMQNPFSTIITYLNHAISDMALILVTSWYKLLTPEYLDFQVSENRIIFVLTVISFGMFLFYFRQSKEQDDSETSSIKRQMLFVGALALFLGLLPAYAADFIMHQKIEPWNTRFGMGSLFGAALIITVVIEWLIKVPKTRWLIIATICGLLVGWHLHYTNDFRWAWEKQVNFYRQLYLRAPEILPNTAIIANEEFLMFMGDYPTSYGVNSIYVTQDENFGDVRETDYWFFPLVKFYNNLEQHLNGKPFSNLRAGLVFVGDPKGSIAITFEPGLGQCLWVLRPEYTKLKALPELTKQLATISFVDRIKQAPENPDSFLLKYLYTNPEQDWCYYYEKADLAYQYEKWDEVIRLWKTANQNGLQPDNGFEYLPFIEAYARTGNWDTAIKLTRISQKTLKGIDPLLCDIWSRIEDTKPASGDKEINFTELKNDLNCDPD